MSDQEELAALRRLAELEKKAGNPAFADYQPPAAPKRIGSMAGNVLDSFSQGATFGFADEITAAEAALLGRTPEGGWFDYSRPMGERYDRALAAEREQNARFRETNPTTSIVSEIGGGLATTLIPGVGQIGAPVRGAATMSNMGRGFAGGAALGGLYGFGSGEGGFTERAQNAVLPALAGGAIGAAVAPLTSGGTALATRMTEAPVARDMGVTPEAMRVVRETLAQDAAMGGGAANIARGGPDAMLAEAGPGAVSLLDVVGQNPGGRQVVIPAVQGRASQAGQDLTRALDDILGAPQGINETARGIASGTASARNAAYDAAYAVPINYADDTGRAIETALGKIPNSTLATAIREANEEMQSLGIRNQQIMAQIADDGTVTFREMPNVRQLDEIKKALQRLGYEQVDQFGRPTGAGARARRLAGELRDALGRAVPEYNAATAAGADKIAMDQALDLGQTLLQPGTTREAVRDAVRGMSDAERRMVGSGLRTQIDDTMANVTRAVSDGNMDAREATKAIRDLSSRAAREKLEIALGKETADRLVKELDQAASAMELRAGVAQGSRTEPRRVVNEMIRDQEDTAVNALLSGAPVNAGQRVLQGLTGRTPADMARMREGTYGDIARLLTEARGPDAQSRLSMLLALSQQVPAVQQQYAGRLQQLTMPARVPAAVVTEDAIRPTGR